MRRLARRGVRDEQGSATVWLLLLLPVLFLFAGLVLDGGRVVTARQNAANLAEQGARRAIDRLDLNTFRTDSSVGAVKASDAQSAACDGMPASVTACTATATTDGQVRVELSLRTDTALLSAIGISEITVTGAGQARPAVGDTQEDLR